MTNIYLDIDGVLIANEINPANYANVFIEYVLTHYPDSAYWLTTHCQGDTTDVFRHIGHLFPEKTIEYMKMIKPTTWLNSPNKTSAIDFSQPFLWFDDDLFYGEKQELLKHNALDNWIEVNLHKNPNQLQDFINSFPLPV